MSDPATALFNHMEGVCKAREYTTHLNPNELSRTQTRSSVVFDSFNESASDPGSLKEDELGELGINVLKGLFIDTHSQYAVQIGTLEEQLTPGKWEESYRLQVQKRWQAHQRLAAIARTWLVAGYSDDMNLFLVGPPGSSNEKEWNNYSQVIERNDLVCRKLVWLPSKNESMWPTEISDFLERTFLATPWLSNEDQKNVPLDSLADLTKTLGNWSAVFDLPQFASESPAYRDLVKKLVEELDQ